jgi:hypothetical protein
MVLYYFSHIPCFVSLVMSIFLPLYLIVLLAFSAECTDIILVELHIEPPTPRNGRDRMSRGVTGRMLNLMRRQICGANASTEGLNMGFPNLLTTCRIRFALMQTPHISDKSKYSYSVELACYPYFVRTVK